MSDKKHFEENIEPITYPKKGGCKNGRCGMTSNEINFANGFDCGAKRQLETILEKYVLVPRHND